jgi:hypothetical protein
MCACPELCLIQDIAEIDKHRGLSRPSVNVIEIVGAGSPGGTLFTSGPFGMDQRTPESTLAIMTADGKIYKLDDVLERSIKFWRSKLT